MSDLKLPPRPFLYTMDQIATLLSCTESYLKNNLAHFKGRTITRRTPDEILFMNIAKEDETPNWRVEHTELVRWLRRKGFKVIGY